MEVHKVGGAEQSHPDHDDPTGDVPFPTSASKYGVHHAAGCCDRQGGVGEDAEAPVFAGLARSDQNELSEKYRGGDCEDGYRGSLGDGPVSADGRRDASDYAENQYRQRRPFNGQFENAHESLAESRDLIHRQRVAEVAGEYFAVGQGVDDDVGVCREIDDRCSGDACERLGDPRRLLSDPKIVRAGGEVPSPRDPGNDRDEHDDRCRR